MLPIRFAGSGFRVVALGASIALVLAGCSSSTAEKSESPRRGQVLPVKENPIANTSGAPGLEITSVLVENNEDPKTGKGVSDHLEVALSNSGSARLSGFEVFSTFTDRKTKASESYYTKLPASFTIAPGAGRIAHFDDTGATDHFPVNSFSLYSTSRNALDVTVTVSAEGVAVQNTTVKKDKGGAEEND